MEDWKEMCGYKEEPRIAPDYRESEKAESQSNLIFVLVIFIILLLLK